ncbi:MAG: DUF421 domain-containing protein [Bacillota bacterium]|nr:DUF421 domain-containing protein [Bacillota bacterium]MDD3298453.1 DUF421 domain-containing protein [Bacillota bacterium]MDD3850782.1 DUF421 domain-containing protein [Bacillota bacterium]MDD4707303.1 DUF421 domain-containing protein [Bacillota bacterium]
MLIVFIRSLLLYAVLAITIRIMGKRQIGQLQPFEFVLAVLIAELAGIPMSDTDIPLANGLVAILTLMISQVTLAYITLKSNKARGIICGTPSILVERGKIMEDEMRRLRYNINDLIEQLRLNGYPNIADVDYAILETDGQLSVIPKPEKRPIVTEDLNIQADYEGLPLSIILDGRILQNDLIKLGLTEEWLMNELRSAGYTDASKVLFACIDGGGKLFVHGKQKR